MSAPARSVLFLALLVGLGAATASEGAQPAFSEHTVSLPTGIEMRYYETGDPDGETVFFVHGFTDSSLSFHPTIEALLALRPGLRAISVDLRGHGGTSMPPAAECAPAPERCFTIATLAADVRALIETLAIERMHVVGHSMGSMVAQDLALAAPDRIESLVLMGSAARVVGNPVIERFIIDEVLEGTWRPALETRGLTWPADAYDLTPIDADPAVEAWLLENWVTEMAADPDHLANLAEKTARTPIGAWLGAARAVLRFDNVTRLGELRVPTLVLWATQDVVTPESDQILLRSALDAASGACRTGYVWKQYGRERPPASGNQESDLGHNFHWGAPEAVAADLAAWLERGAPDGNQYYVDPEQPDRITVEQEAAVVFRGTTCS